MCKIAQSWVAKVNIYVANICLTHSANAKLCRRGPFGFNFLLSDKAGGGVDGTGAGKMGELMALVGVEHQGLMAHGAVKMGPFSRKSAIK